MEARWHLSTPPNAPKESDDWRKNHCMVHSLSTHSSIAIVSPLQPAKVWRQFANQPRSSHARCPILSKRRLPDDDDPPALQECGVFGALLSFASLDSNHTSAHTCIVVRAGAVESLGRDTCR